MIIVFSIKFSSLKCLLFKKFYGNTFAWLILIRMAYTYSHGLYLSNTSIRKTINRKQLAVFTLLKLEIC